MTLRNTPDNKMATNNHNIIGPDLACSGHKNIIKDSELLQRENNNLRCKIHKPRFGFKETNFTAQF